MSRKRRHNTRAWTFARAVMRHDTDDVGRHGLLARGWQAGYAAALRDVRRLRHESHVESYSAASLAEILREKIDKLLEPKR